MQKADRKKILLRNVNLQGAGLEIGPLCWPIVTKDEANIQYVDHVSTKRLLELYKNDPGVPAKQIVSIDYPLEGRSLQKTVGSKRFDYILASHVIEHVPDMIAWLNDMASVLKPGGILSLAIPDRRFTFDIDRSVSRAADIIGAHLDGLKKPSSVTVFDYFANYRSKVDPKQAWEGQLYISEEAGPHRYTLRDAVKYCLVNRDTSEYVDTHCFVFTPSSFFVALRDILELSFIPYEVASFHDTAENEYEFFVSLRKIPKTKKKSLVLATIPHLPSEPSRRAMQAEIERLNQSLATVQEQLDHVHGSVSWKVTKPLRGARKLYKKPR